MSKYIVLIPDNETEWAATDEAEKQRIYGLHAEFAEALAERGHKVLSSAQLVDSSHARTVRQGVDGLTITDGPYAESVEQLSGFYVIQSSDFDDLVRCAGIIASGEGAIEVRPCVEGSGDA